DKVEGRCPADPVLPEVWRDAMRAGNGSSSIDFRPPLTSDSPSRSRPRAPTAGRGEASGARITPRAPHSMYSTYLALFTCPFTSTSVGRTTISCAVSTETVKLPLIKQCTVSGPPFGRSTQGLLRESVYYSTSRHLASLIDKTSEKPRRACYRERSSAS